MKKVYSSNFDYFKLFWHVFPETCGTHRFRWRREPHQRHEAVLLLMITFWLLACISNLCVHVLFKLSLCGQAPAAACQVSGSRWQHWRSRRGQSLFHIVKLVFIFLLYIEPLISILWTRCMLSQCSFSVLEIIVFIFITASHKYTRKCVIFTRYLAIKWSFKEGLIVLKALAKSYYPQRYFI